MHVCLENGRTISLHKQNKATEQDSGQRGAKGATQTNNN